MQERPDPVWAREEHQRRAAVRALDDPAALARAARIIRTALARGRLNHQDLDGEITAPLPALGDHDAT